MLKGANGNPAPGLIATFVAGAANPVDLEMGPGGDLYYADFDGGTIRRIQLHLTQQPAAAGRRSGQPRRREQPHSRWTSAARDQAIPTATRSGTPGISTPMGLSTTRNGADRLLYVHRGRHLHAALRVTDSRGASAVDTVTVTVTGGNTPPTATISTPAPGTTWKVGDTITFNGSATDAQDGPLPGRALSWTLILQHCPSNCHTHPVQDFVAVGGGSFVAPDHEYPSYLELRLTATDSGGLQDTESLRLDPQTVVLTFQSTPGGLRLTVGGIQSTAAFSRTVIVGSTNSISAVTPQTKGKQTYIFSSWSDGGAQTHNITAPAAATTYTARFRR